MNYAGTNTHETSATTVSGVLASRVENRVLFALVHGTWGRGSPWLNEGSLLRTTLTQRFPNATVRVVDWSGRNNANDRIEAAEKLRRALAGADDNSVGHRFVLSHSHGGNVALMALPYLTHTLDGLVCFSTPFFSIRSRNRTRTESVVSAFALCGFLLLGIAVWFQFVNGTLWKQLLAWSSLTLAVLITIAYFRLPVAVSAAVKAFHYPKPNTRLLIVRAPGDEASVVLASAYLVSATIATLWRYTAEFARLSLVIARRLVFGEPLTRTQRKIAAPMFVVTFIAAMYVVISLPESDFDRAYLQFRRWLLLGSSRERVVSDSATGRSSRQRSAMGEVTVKSGNRRTARRSVQEPLTLRGVLGFQRGVSLDDALRKWSWYGLRGERIGIVKVAVMTPLTIVLFMISCFVVVGLLILLLLPAHAMMYLAFLFYSGALALAAPGIVLTAEAAPPGESTVLQMSPLDAPGLMHSVTYDDPDSVNATCDWLAGIVTNVKPRNAV